MASLLAFRIINFRSIVDSGWVQFSTDGITVLVGQNESGKTSVLEALHCALNNDPITTDDIRIGKPEPIVYLKVQVSCSEVATELQGDNATQWDLQAVELHLKALNGVIDLKCNWARETNNKGAVEYQMEIDLLTPSEFAAIQSEEVARAVASISSRSAEQNTGAEDSVDGIAGSGKENVFPTMTTADLAGAIYSPLPTTVLFNAESGLLPNTVDLTPEGKPTGRGAGAANNFVTIAEIDLPELIQGDPRSIQNILNKANDRVSEDFTSFWSQVIGISAKLKLRCEVANYGSEAGDKAGKKHLVFWISDGNTQLYPKQRSLGVRWFVSFFLQLRASVKLKNNRVFLLDEPGANLHAKAQGDVLKLINRLRDKIPIVYSTHSPQMIEYDKLFRIRAVQRDGDQEDSPTSIIDGHQLATASSDTLSPILAAMGSDMSNQTAIKKYRNVLLEEVSGYYYLRGFWLLLGVGVDAHFIPATGVNKVPMLANMFLGWGLDFVVAVDDDNQGRGVFNSLKKEMFGDLDELARRQLVKLPGCPSIEDAFSKADFRKFVLNDGTAKIDGSNADYLKQHRISKPMKALEFWLSVEAGKVKKTDLDAESLERIAGITTAISKLLEARPST